MDDFTKICSVEELELNIGTKFVVNDTHIMVVKTDKGISVLSNICIHHHVSILHDGFIEKDFVACPAHGWQFNINTGKMSNGSKGIEVYKSKVEDGFVYAIVKEKTFNW